MKDLLTSENKIKTNNKEHHPELWFTIPPNQFYSGKDTRATGEFFFFALLKCNKISFTEATCCIGPGLIFISQESSFPSIQSHRNRKQQALKASAVSARHYLKKASVRIQSSCYSRLCSDNFLMSLTVCYQEHLSLSVSVGGEYD